MHSNRRPDEEGIETAGGVHLRHPLQIPTADLMKKGLRLFAVVIVGLKQNSNRRPDEEGIETQQHYSYSQSVGFQPQT